MVTRRTCWIIASAKTISCILSTDFFKVSRFLHSSKVSISQEQYVNAYMNATSIKSHFKSNAPSYNFIVIPFIRSNSPKLVPTSSETSRSWLGITFKKTISRIVSRYQRHMLPKHHNHLFVTSRCIQTKRASRGKVNSPSTAGSGYNLT